MDWHGQLAEQIVGKLRVGELKVPLVVELEQRRRERMVVLQVQVVNLRFAGGVAALLAHVHLGPALLVGVLMLHAVHLLAMRLQGAALREALLAQVALVRPHARVGARVPLEVEGVVESLAAEGAQIALDVRVALHVPIEQALQRKGLHADTADELIVAGGRVLVGSAG